MHLQEYHMQSSDVSQPSYGKRGKPTNRWHFSVAGRTTHWIHAVDNSTEQQFNHAEVSAEHIDREGATQQIEVTHELDMAFDSIPVNHHTLVSCNLYLF